LPHLQRTGYAFDRDTMTRPADSSNPELLTQQQVLADDRAQQSTRGVFGAGAAG
jgi:hypothetical protein